MAKTALEKWREENEQHRTATNAKQTKLQQWEQENRQYAPSRETAQAPSVAPRASATSMYGNANRNTSIMDMATRAKLMQTANEMADIKARQAKALENPRASTAYARQTEKQPMQDRAQRVAEIREGISTLPEEQGRVGKAFSGIGMNIPASLMYNVEGVKQGIENKQVFRGTEEAQEYADAVAEFNRIQRTAMEDDPAYIAALERVRAAEAGMKLANERTDVPIDSNNKAAQLYAANRKQLAEVSEGLGPVGSAVAELGVDLGTWGAAALTGPLAPAVLASDVMAGKMYDVQQNGGGASEAAARGAVSAIIEYFAEKMGFDRAAAIFKKPGAANLWDVFLNGVAESGEESVSYGLNFIADKLFGDPNAAFRAEELLKSAGMGFLFGDIVGAGATVANRARLSGIGFQYQDVAPELVAEGLQMKQDTDAYRTAAEMQRKLDAGKTLSNVDVGRVVQDNETAMAPLRQAAMEMAEAEVKQRTAERTAAVSKSLGYGKEGARVFGEIYNGGEVDAKTLLAVFDTPYQAGLTGGDGKKYTDPMQIAAYSAGNSDRIAQQGIDAKAKPGKVFSKAESGFDYTNAPADLTQQQKNFGNLMAKTFGIKGNFVNGETAYNARYVSNVGEVNFAKDFGIDPQLMQKLGDMDFQQKVERLANKRQQSFAFYVAHEIADHVAANRAPVEMRAFNNAMYNYLRETEGANLARERMAFYGSRGANLDTKGAIEEVAADSILMLYDGDEQKFMTAMERVLNGTDEQAKRGAKTWGEALKNIIEKLKAWARKLTGRDNAQAKADVEKSVAELERLRDMFEAAISKAAQNTEQARSAGATKNATQEGDVKKFNKKGDLYAGKSLTEDSSVYDYDFLVNLPDMQVIEMPALSEVKSGDKVDQQKAIQMGLDNAAQIGRKVSDSVSAVTNVYTGREIRVSQNGLGHSLDGSNVGRLRTNARLTAIGGAIIQNAVPVNALNSKNTQANGTYAMAGLLKSGDRDVVAIVTVEQHTDRVTGIDYVDIAHSINGRLDAKKEGSRSSTRETGNNPATASFTVSVANFLEIVNNTHRSILSEDVLKHFGVTKSAEGYYTGKTKFSLKDSEGNTLSQKQAEYFKDSKVRDRNGNLKVMYRGGNEDFTVFDRKKSSYSNLYGRGFYFTDSESHAKQYGKAKAFYLDIKNPVSTTERTITEEQMRKYLEAVAENEDDYSFENYGYGATVDSVLDGLFSGKSDFAMLYDVSQTAIGDMVEAVELFNEVNGTDYDGLILDTETVTFRSNQIKSVANEKPTADKDIRFSLKGEQQMAKELKRIRTEGAKAGKSAEEIRAEVAKIVDPEYAELLKTYGAIERGETPFRDIQVPERTGKNRKVSQTVRTILEAEATPDAMIPDVEALVAEGALSFESYTDDQAIADATAKLQTKGWSNTLSKWISEVDKGVVTKENTVTGWALYNNAANKGDVETALTILQKMVGHQRNAAQALQATRVLKKMSPDAQLYGVQRSVQDLQDELNEKYGEKGAPKLKVDEELGRKFMEAETQEERDDILEDIYRDIGHQLPSTFMDKWNAWRYLAMLGNTRTHVRNIVGNAGFAPLVAAKNLTATAIESAVGRVAGDKMGRTKAFVGANAADRALLTSAWDDYANVADIISGGGKYNDAKKTNQLIQEGRQIFEFKPLEKARKGNSAALEAEDVWFSKPHYAAALASYCKANNITAEQIASGEGMDAARAYAIKEAQKATYKDMNAISNLMSRRFNTGGEWGKVGRFGNTIMEGVLPFRKTPANILARGLEYSPLGLANGIKQMVFDIRRGNKTAAEAIDTFSAGFTGSMLMLAGWFLARMALVRGGGSGDEKEKEFAKLQGRQDYSMELPDGTSVTLDWLAPEALPFFVGVNLWELTEGDMEEINMETLKGSLGSISDPMLEMSCLQSLNDLLDSVGYARNNGQSSVMKIAATVATSYLTQGLPTVFGQIERISENKRMKTYTEAGKFLDKDTQYTLGKASAKMYGDYNQVEYVDAWGRTESTGSLAQRAFNNLINPSYTSKIETSAMEDELLRLYKATGENVFPASAAKYFTVDKQRKDLTGEEWVQYATDKGQASYKLLTELIDSKAYASMTDAEKAKAVREALDYANQTAKEHLAGYDKDSWMDKADEAEKKYKIPVSTYSALRGKTSGITSLKDKNGETIENSKSLLIMEEVYNTPGLTDKQRQAMFEYLGVGKSVRHYNKSLVKQKLTAMRKNAK